MDISEKINDEVISGLVVNVLKRHGLGEDCNVEVILLDISDSLSDVVIQW